MHIFRTYISCCKWYLEIHTDCSQVAELIKKFYGGFIISQRPAQDNLAFFSVLIKKSQTGYIISRKGASSVIKTLNDVAFYLYAIIDKLVESTIDEQYCVLHGGIIAKNQQAYGIIAPTKTGKSTLITNFSLMGFDYLSDDYIFIKRDNRELTPLPLPSLLRETTVLDKFLSQTHTITRYNELKGENNTIVPLYHESKDKYYLKKVFFIQRKPNNSIRLMNKGELYKSLLFNMKTTFALEHERITLKQIADNIDGYELIYKDFNFVSSCFSKLQIAP